MRVFLGIPLPEGLSKSIEEFSKSNLPYKGVNIVPWHNLHFTLNFFGEISDERISSIIEKMKKVDIPCFTIRLEGIDAFPSKQFIRVIYIKGVVDNNIESRLKNFSLSLGGEPLTVLHLTIARVKRKVDLKEFFSLYSSKAFPSYNVDSFVLYQSKLAKPFPIYKPIYKLKFC